jgi:CheY-like chemotaxis protein
MDARRAADVQWRYAADAHQRRSHSKTIGVRASDASACARRLPRVVEHSSTCGYGAGDWMRKGLKGADMKKILVADDDATIADLLQQALETEGYQTSKVTQALRFFDAVMEHKPDLILLDLMMPYLDGEDELRLLQMTPAAQHIPVIVVTAKQEAAQEIDKYRQLGVSEIVTKPFDLNKLVDMIKRIIG